MQIKYSKTAAKAIMRLDSVMKQRIKAGIEKLPAGDVKKLKGYTTAFRLRIGDYRVLFDMENDSIEVTDVLPRGEAYKK